MSVVDAVCEIVPLVPVIVSEIARGPVLVAVFFIRPELVPFTMGVLFGSHFLPYGWFYRSRGYTTLGISAPIVALLLQLAAPARSFVLIPLVRLTSLRSLLGDYVNRRSTTVVAIVIAALIIALNAALIIITVSG